MVAVLDLDDVVATIGGFVGLSPDLLELAFHVYGQVIGAWLGNGFDVVAHAPAFNQREIEAVLQAIPTGTRIRTALLLTTYEVAVGRVSADTTRTLSKDVEVLRRAYDRFNALLPSMDEPDWTFDTDVAPVSEIVDRLVLELNAAP